MKRLVLTLRLVFHVDSRIVNQKIQMRYVQECANAPESVDEQGVELLPKEVDHHFRTCYFLE